MSQRIIFKSDDGGVCVIIPTPEALSVIGIETIALKDVPSGRPYKIVDSADIPTDRSQRNAWTVDESELTDGVGADYGAGSDWTVVDFDEDGKPDYLIHNQTHEVKKVGQE